MGLLFYNLVYPFLWFVSILPFPIIYFISDVICFFIYDVFGYRKKTVRENLRLTLPHLTEKERLKIERKFYHHLCDLFLEMAKTMSISKAEIEKRYSYSNLEVYLDLEKQDKSIALMCAHYASYEWAVSLNYKASFHGYGIYKKIQNKYFDNLVKKIRSKFKANLVTTKEIIPTISSNNRAKKLSLYGFASDQSPKVGSAFHWANFMGIYVPVHTGAEMLSKKYNMNVVFLRTKKIKRGYYEASFEVLSENACSVPNYEITDRFLKLVEQQIYENPEYYLWTHKRWKHRKEAPIQTN